MKTIKVVCGIIWQGEKVFIARRKPEKSLGGYWEFPGGKIEDGENPEHALLRELKEELGMEVRLKKYFGQNNHQYPNFQIELIAYECEFIQASFKLTDHDEYKFVSSKELIQLRLAPADIPIAQSVLNNTP